MFKLGLGLGFSKSKKTQTPLDFFGSDLVLWLDANDPATIVQAAGSSPAQWLDKSQYGNHAVAPSFAASPQYLTNRINGKPAWYWGATAVRFTVTDAAVFDNAGGQHAYAVARWDTLGAFSYILSRYAGSGAREWGLGKTSSTAPANVMQAIYTTDGINAVQLGRKTTVVSGTPYILSFSTTPGGNADFNINGGMPEQRSTGITVFDRGTALNLTIGDQTLLGAAMRGDVPEIIIYKGAKTPAREAYLASYFKIKYNIDFINPALSMPTLTAGQSNKSNASSTTAPFNNEGVNAYKAGLLASGLKQVPYYESAISSSAILEKNDTSGTKHWIKNDLSDGPSLSGFITNGGSYNFGFPNDITQCKAILIANGEADATAIGNATATKAEVKAAYIKMIERLNEICPNAKIVQTYVGRRTGGSDTGTQQMREIQKEVADLYSFLYTGWENYHLNLYDSIHRDPSGQTYEGTRQAQYVAALYGERGFSGILGPELVSATYSGATITATLALDGGSAISGSDTAPFRITDDGVPVTINSLTVSGNQITFTLSAPIASGSTVILINNYGQGATVTPGNVVQDGNGNPVQTHIGLNVTEA